MRIKTIIDTLSALTDEQKEMDVSVYCTGRGEYFPVDEVWEVVEDDDVLDVGSVIFTIQD